LFAIDLPSGFLGAGRCTCIDMLNICNDESEAMIATGRKFSNRHIGSPSNNVSRFGSHAFMK
jgi:hypothetical protein